MLFWNRFNTTPNRHGTAPCAALPVVRVRGVGFHAVNEAQSIAWMIGEMEAGRGGWALTANLDHLRRLVHAPEYATLCAGATLVLADGMPVVWASRMQGTPLPQRVAGSNLVSSLSEAAAKAGRSIYLLGGDPGTAEEAAAVLSSRYPGLKIAGLHCPSFGFEKDARALKHIEKLLTDASPDIVYVALGSPKQEKLIASLRGRLPGAWWLGVGVSFSFLCGRVKRAPQWVQRVGCEWLHRLMQEPSRLAGRYLRDDLPFAATLFADAVRRRLRPGVDRAV